MKQIFTLALFLLLATKSMAQDPASTMTVLGLQQFVSNTIQELQNAGTTLAGSGSIVIGGATNQLTGLLNQFNSSVGTNVTAPLNQLSYSVQQAAYQLYSATNRLHVIATQQQACLVLNSQAAIAGIATITSEFKNGTILFTTKDAPRIGYFQFAGHIPSVVPQNGGLIKVSGFKLWENQNYPPLVTIMSQDQQTKILDIAPQRSSDDNSFSFALDNKTIASLSGKCIQIKVVPRYKRFLSGVKNYETYYLPVCMPDSYNAQYKIKAHLQYPCERTETPILEARNFHFDNSSCEDVHNVTLTKCWDIPNNGFITEVVYTSGPKKENQSNIAVTFSGNCITAAGSLDRATCVRVPVFGNKLIHSSWWDATIAPKVSYKVNDTPIVNNESAFTKVESTTSIYVDLPKPCPGNLSNTFWFEIVQSDGKHEQTIYSSSRTNNSTLQENKGGLIIDASYNATPVNNTSQLCVKITQPTCEL